VAPSLTAEQARAAAEARGLQLVTSSTNQTGFLGVTKHSGSTFRAEISVAGKSVRLGIYKTAEEAALKVAEHLGPERAAAEQAALCKVAPSLTAEQARAAAEARGLQLVTSSTNQTGFLCVKKTQSGKFRAEIEEEGKSVSLGTYKTAEEAALKVAEHLGPERAAAEQAALKVAERLCQERAAAKQKRAAAQARAGEPLGATQRPLTLGEVTSMHSQRTGAYNPAAIRASIAAYDCHMLQRPPTFDDEHLNPTAMLGDFLCSIFAKHVGLALKGYEQATTLDDEKRHTLATEFIANIKDSLSKSLAAAFGGPPTPAEEEEEEEEEAEEFEEEAAEEAEEAAAANLTAQVPKCELYQHLLKTASGERGLTQHRINAIHRNDQRRGGAPFVTLMTGAQIDPVTGINDGGRRAHEAVAAVQRDEAERRTSEDTQEARLENYRKEMVANVSGKEAVIGRNGLTTPKGKIRAYSRSFTFSIVRNDQFGAAIRRIDSKDVGPIGDDMTFEEVDNLLSDERVPEPLKALLRLSYVMLVESELARAEVILGWRRSPAILAKGVGSAMAPTPLAPLCRWGGAQAGAAAYPTYDYPSVALTRTGYQHVSYNLPSFDFDVCACALTPDADWAFLPTSLQTGGDEYMFDSDRFGTFKVHGSHAFVA
jgi:hypothetical protein